MQREKVLSTAIRRQQSAEDFFGKDLTQLEAEQMQKWLDQTSDAAIHADLPETASQASPVTAAGELSPE